MTNAVTSIVIVGGGTAGWITAGTLAAKIKREHEANVSITLVESPDIPTIGVGEGTWPTMRTTLKKMGISETDFMRECNVSFKQGAKFAQWTTGTPDDFYYHPLVLPTDFDNTNLAPHWHHHNKGSFSENVCYQEALCEHGLAPKLITTAEYDAVANYAYHLDAGAFSEFLKRHCTTQLGVTHILDNVVSVKAATNGDISAVITQNNGDIDGDLFIDCTGFKSLLIGQHYNTPFKSCRDVLFADRALAVHVPYPDEQSPIASHTISTAQTSGWIWDIGLTNRRGVGHVFSSAHISDDQAHQQLLSYITPSYANADSLSVKSIDIDSGHREKFWVNNCVAVGLSAGFLEPLEASALVLVEISASMIAEQLPANRASMNIVAKRFNETFLYRWQRIIDFLKLHYMLSKRIDSKFWIDNRESSSIPDSLNELLTIWQHQYPWHGDFDRAVEVFPAASYQYVLYGMQFNTCDPRGIAPDRHQHALNLIRKNEKYTHQLLGSMPTNRALIEKINQYGLQPV
ncbi:tryptophan halogenase family protein [Echinimonas agarilytica]|uniref:Tryptophan 7-halogenase n=1 Tax=Echinimonas agarilytica TaxID=1215918 RepID=A0AA41W716_9GAMM|nr:tryptophan halogenase family protein [Echinimonas agarilytica]MCM2679984.1 tryptophan 7-halogenase [Echinimonas agarilytica]